MFGEGEGGAQWGGGRGGGTNFVVGAARGRDRDADALLDLPGDTLRLALPSVCIMET
jgi:hypothetical protein